MPRSSGTPDIVLSNNKLNHNIHLCSGPLTSSDHLPIIITISTSPIQINIPPKYNYSNANWESFIHELENFSIPDLNGRSTEQIDNILKTWFDAVKTSMENNIPVMRYRTLVHPKTTNDLKLLKTAFTNIQNRAELTGWTPQLRQTMKVLQNNITYIVRRQSDKMWEELIQKTETLYKNPDQFWKRIRNLMGTETTSDIPYLLNPNGVKLTTDAEKANEFRRHLRNVFNISREENANFCPDTQQEIEDYLQQTEEHLGYDTIDLNRLDERNPLIKPFTRNNVLAVIRSFKNKKAARNSKIDKTILMKMPINMIDALTDIYNAAFSSGFFPTAFKQALIKMLLKKGKQTIHPVNYRPISLLETVSKTYEKPLNSRLKQYLIENNHTNPNQHAYRNNRGTISAIAITYQRIAMSQQEHFQCNMVNRDISKAFDKVWHAGLKFKICGLNLPRIFTATLCSFLDNRSATIQINNYKTESFSLNAGVPQGAVLSPTLFNIFTSNI